LATISFFEVKSFEIYFEYQKYILILFAFILSVFKFKIIKKGFVFPVALIVISIISSIFLAKYSWDQSFFHSIKSTADHLIWLVFFYLIHVNLSVVIIEKTLISIGYIYILLFFYQFFFLDVPLFGYHEFFDYSRGLKRNIFPGNGIFFFFLFYILNLSLSDKRFSLRLLLILLFLILLLQATKQYFFATGVILLLHLFRLRLYKKYLAYFSLASFFFFALSFDNIISDNIAMFNQSDEITNNIRFLAIGFFLEMFSPNTISSFFGNGVPWFDSDYGSFYYSTCVEKLHFYLDDVGIFAFFTMFGLIGVLGILIIFKKAYFFNLPSRYYYLKYYFLFLFLTSLSSYTIFHTDYLVVNVLLIYIFHKIYLQNKNLRKV